MGKYMTEFLEKLVRDIAVDIKSEEVKDIQSAVNELLDRMLVNVEFQNPHFKSRRIVPCGSMAEKTRIWRFAGHNKTATLEFDFLAILEQFSQDSFKTNKSCGGFMEVEDIDEHLPTEYTNIENEIGAVGKINAKRLSFNYRLQMMKSVSSLCNCYTFESETRMANGCELVSLGNITKKSSYDIDCKNCKVSKNTGELVFATGVDFHPVELNCTVAFLWERHAERFSETPCLLSRQEKSIKQEFIILVDFLPAIEILSQLDIKEHQTVLPPESSTRRNANPDIPEHSSDADPYSSSIQIAKPGTPEQPPDTEVDLSSIKNAKPDFLEHYSDTEPDSSSRKNAKPDSSKQHSDSEPDSSSRKNVKMDSSDKPGKRPELNSKNTTKCKEDTLPRHVCFLVPKVCKFDHITCWKISHCKFERHLFDSTSGVHRDCYMALKFILDYIVSDMSNIPDTPTTYILKTALLYHIRNCTAETPTMTTCISRIMEFLSDAHKDALLPHLHLKTLNLLAATTIFQGYERHQDNIKWFKNRNAVLGNCWKFIIRVLENLELMLPSRFDFDKIQTALELSTLTYGRAYLDTTLKVLHEPSDDGLFDVLCRVCRGNYLSRDEVNSVIKVKGDIANLWEQNLSHIQYASATKLYSSMQCELPRILLENVREIKEETLCQPNLEESEIIYSRVSTKQT